jgi:glycosyltransferase involved in cell wall biosynthesis
MKRILVLYKELAGYFMACLEELCLSHDVQADVIAYPVHSDAPFQFDHTSRIRLISRSEVTDNQLQEMIGSNDYDLIFTGGWFDKGYLRALRHRSCPALLGFDNAWNGSVKQRLSALYGRFLIKPLFDYAFVPGSKQANFAKKLGFSDSQIIRGAYSCDVAKFSRVHHQHQSKNRLVYAGRYSPEKHVNSLFEIFHELAEKNFPNWELHCIGTGPLWNDRLESPHIIHHGFMQPEKLLEFMSTGNAFVLPSTFEPWGVVVHEFAAAGYPLVLSDAVGAGEAFLEDKKNGFHFHAGNDVEFQAALSRMMSQEPEHLEKMGQYSRQLAQLISPKTWAASLASMMK